MSTIPESRPFNAIKGLERLAILQIVYSQRRQQEQLKPTPPKQTTDKTVKADKAEYRERSESEIKELRYAESMLYAYDGDEKGVRSNLRGIARESRKALLHALGKLRAPSNLTSRPEYDNVFDWLKEVEVWLKESAPVRVQMEAILRSKNIG